MAIKPRLSCWYLIMLILLDDPLLYDPANISDSADLLIINNSVLVSVTTELRRHIECRTEVYVEKDRE